MRTNGFLGALFAASIALAAAGYAPAQAASSPLTIADLQRVITLSDATIAPDGTHAAVLVKHIVWKNDTTVTDLDVVDLHSGAVRTLVANGKHIADAAYSPDGSHIAYIDHKGKKTKPQLWCIALAGGVPRIVTKAPGGVAQFAWSRDGKRFAYAAADAAPKKSGAARFEDSFVFTTEPIVARALPLPEHLFVIGAAGGSARQLTFGSQSVAAGEAQSTLSWSRDDRSIAFVLAPDAILNDADRSRIALVDLAGGKTVEPTRHTIFSSAPLFSPDGNHLAYLHSRGDNQSHQTMAYVANASGRNGNPITKPFDVTVQDLTWMPNSSGIMYTADKRTHLALNVLSLNGKRTRLNIADLHVTSALEGALSRDGSLVFVATTPRRPQELYILRPGRLPQRLTHFNDTIARGVTAATPQTIGFHTTLGIDGDAVLYMPPGFRSAQKYPLSVLIHGGPTSESTRGFDALAQLMAARGWLVLEPNYRGSDGLGRAYMRGVLYDPDKGPGADVMAAVDAVRAKGIVDDSRIAVSGWSYGGIMTAWMISKYHIWRAAVSGASVNDWFTDYGVADDSDSDRALFHGSPYVGSNAAEWRAASAITYAADVSTPVLLLSDVGDNRDPFATSSMYWRALRDNGKDATLRVWPVYGHFPGDPVRRLDVYRHWIDYIAQHFAPSAAPHAHR